jgi:gamma-glutamyl hercynylcysteine S-oxide synthase
VASRLRLDLAEVYDAAETPRATRGDIPYLRLEHALEYMEDVRDRMLRLLEAGALCGGSALTRDALVLELVLQHKHQHTETMLQTLALAEPGVYSPRRRLATAPTPASTGSETVRVEGSRSSSERRSRASSTTTSAPATGPAWRRSSSNGRP